MHSFPIKLMFAYNSSLGYLRTNKNNTGNPRPLAIMEPFLTPPTPAYHNAVVKQLCGLLSAVCGVSHGWGKALGSLPQA